MQLLATKMIAAGFAASMALSGSTTLTSTSVGRTSQPNTVISPAASSPHPSNCDTFRFSLRETASFHLSTTFQSQSLGCGDSYLKTPEDLSSAHSSPLDLWLEKLIVLESNGRKNIKILDHNGEHSFGCLQFQKETFEEFGLKYKLIAPDDEITDLLYDCQLQKEIAKKMIEDNYNNWRRWYTSVKIKKLGLPPKNDVEKVTVAEAKLN